MALEYLTYYLVPARGCGNKLKAYFRHLAGSREEVTVDRHRPRYLKKAMTLSLVSVYLARMTFAISEGDELFRVRGLTTSGNVTLAYILQHLLIAAVLNVNHDSDKGYPNPKCVRGWRNLVVSINIQTMLSLEPEY
jgi:hypothetical protein